MPYIEMDYNCMECVCPLCERFQTGDCLEGADSCDSCDNDQHVRYCWWDTNEDG